MLNFRHHWCFKWEQPTWVRGGRRVKLPKKWMENEEWEKAKWTRREKMMPRVDDSLESCRRERYNSTKKKKMSPCKRFCFVFSVCLFFRIGSNQKMFSTERRNSIWRNSYGHRQSSTDEGSAQRDESAGYMSVNEGVGFKQGEKYLRQLEIKN